MVAAALSNLSKQKPAIAKQVAGAVLFGYTRNKQNGGRIPNYPKKKTKVFCATGDVLCDGQLVILPPHLSYASDSGSAAKFLAQRVAKA